MSSLYILIPVSLLTGLAALMLLLWGYNRSQFDDPEGPKYRMLDEDTEQKLFKDGTDAEK